VNTARLGVERAADTIRHSAERYFEGGEGLPA
jgi:hypothetical protein